MGTRLHISTGGASVQEIHAAIKVASGITIDFPTVYHCTIEYPCKLENARLSKIHTLADIVYSHNIGEFDSYLQAYDYVGYSDHTASLPAVMKALSWVKTCELHFDLDDRRGRETSVGHCWTSAMLRELCDALTVAEIAAQDNLEPAGPDLRADPIDGLRPRMKHREDK
jgi:sialic acid synthase SpsE